MIIDLIKDSWKPLILIALVSLTITWAFGIYNVMIQQQTINGIEIYTFNIRIYLSNLSNAWQTNALNFQDVIPSRTWSNDWSWSNIGNNMAFIFDWLYFPINFVLWLDRWICWLLRLLLAIIGWNIGLDENGNYYSTLSMILTWCIENLFIPYI